MGGIVYLQRQKIQCCCHVGACRDRIWAKNSAAAPINCRERSYFLARSKLNIVKPKPVIIKTKLITREGYNALKAEHDELWFKKRPEVTKIVTWAASLGDRSENADYQYSKRQLRQIDSRIRYLRKRLEDLQIVDYSPQQEGKVFFGAWVEIEDDDGQVLKFRIVGPDEIYGRTDYISIDAPMARALLKKQVDDSFVVQTPTGAKEWLVLDIQYPKSVISG